MSFATLAHSSVFTVLLATSSSLSHNILLLHTVAACISLFLLFLGLLALVLLPPKPSPRQTRSSSSFTKDPRRILVAAVLALTAWGILVAVPRFPQRVSSSSTTTHRSARIL